MMTTAMGVSSTREVTLEHDTRWGGSGSNGPERLARGAPLPSGVDPSLDPIAVDAPPRGPAWLVEPTHPAPP